MEDRSQIPEEVKSLRAVAARMLQGVQPTVSESGLRLYPCAVETDDGVMHPRVYIVEAQAYIREWGVWPWMDRGKDWIPAERIRSLRSSPERLPLIFVSTLLAAGESGMGYSAFSVELRDRRRLYFVTGNAVDFLSWPSDARPDDVVSVTPHDRCPEHRTSAPFSHQSGASYAWSPYRVLQNEQIF